MKHRSGFTLLETMIAIGVLSLVITGALMLTVSSEYGFDRTSAQLDADRSASHAVQRMMRDLQEAKQVTILSPTSLRVFYPQVADDGTYLRSVLDTVNTIDYYRGTVTGTADSAGEFLLRQAAGRPVEVVCTGVTDLQFASTNPSSVDITIRTQRPSRVTSARCEMLHRAIFLRNY